MNKRVVKIEWPTGSVSYYESVIACANALGITKATVHSYLRGKAPMGIKFSYASMTGEEQLLREVLQVNPVVQEQI